jgi:hypothetical protein
MVDRQAPCGAASIAGGGCKGVGRRWSAVVAKQRHRGGVDVGFEKWRLGQESWVQGEMEDVGGKPETVR